MKNLRVAFALPLLLVAAPAFADGDKDPSIFTQPNTGAFLRLEEKDKRAVGRYANLATNGVRIDLTVSAPLDEDTREAALASLRGPAPGFAGRLSFGYDSRKEALRLTEYQSQVSWTYAQSVLMHGLSDADSGASDDASQSESTIVKWYGLYVGNGRKAPLDCKEDAPQDEKPGDKQAREHRISDCQAAQKVLNGEPVSCPSKTGICAGMQGLLGHLDAVYAKTPAKDLDRHVVPNGNEVFWAVLGEVSYSFDRVKAYSREDISATAKGYNDYDVQLGPRLDFYVAPAWAFGIRAGWELTRKVSASKAKRCNTLPSASDSTKGEACSDVLVLDDAPSAQSSAYARLSAMYLWRHVLPSAVPGFEARAGIESLGQAPELDTRFTAFLSPVTGPVLSRFGIGIDLTTPLKTDAAAGTKAGRLSDAAPFLLIGASL